MANCRPPASPYWQLQQGDPYGPSNCAAYCGAAAIAFDTCGAKTPTGREIRAWSSEPIPDPSSPGLNLRQLADVMKSRYGIVASVHIDAPWADFVAATRSDVGTILSVGYDPIRRSVYRGSRVFTGGHALFVAPRLFVYDPLADGRLLGQGYRAFTGPAYYPASLLQSAAGQLPIPQADGTVRRAGFGRAWFLAMPHPHPFVKPSTEVDVNPNTIKPVALCTVRAGVTIYADEARSKVLVTSFGGSTAVQLYGQPVDPAPVGGRYPLVPIRVDMAGGPATDFRIGWVGWDTISAVEPFEPLP